MCQSVGQIYLHTHVHLPTSRPVINNTAAQNIIVYTLSSDTKNILHKESPEVGIDNSITTLDMGVMLTHINMQYMTDICVLPSYEMSQHVLCSVIHSSYDSIQDMSGSQCFPLQLYCYVLNIIFVLLLSYTIQSGRFTSYIPTLHQFYVFVQHCKFEMCFIQPF